MDIKGLKILIEDNKNTDIVLGMGKDASGNFYITTQPKEGYARDKENKEGGVKSGKEM